SEKPAAGGSDGSQPPPRSKTGGPVEPTRTSVALDIGLLAARTVEVQLETGAATRFLTRFHVTQQQNDMTWDHHDLTWGFGLGLKRFLVGTLWVDLVGEQIVGPGSQGTALAVSTQFGIRLPFGKRVYLDPYAGYRHPITTGESGTLFGRTEGVYGGVRF